MRSREARYGYTLIELTVVIAIAALVAGIAVPRILDSSSMRVEVAARQLIMDLRAAQRTAAATHQSGGVAVLDAARYKVFSGSGGASRADPLTQVVEPVDLQALYGVGISPVGGAVTFDVRGRPAAGSTLTFTIGGGRTVTIESQTGYAK